MTERMYVRTYIRIWEKCLANTAHLSNMMQHDHNTGTYVLSKEELME